MFTLEVLTLLWAEPMRRMDLTSTLSKLGFFKQPSKTAKVQNNYWCLIIYVIESLTSHGYKQNEISQELSMETKLFKTSNYTVLGAF
jgi:hypothetical protein